MSDIPEHMLVRRRAVSKRYLSGDGVEIGALHYPLWIDPKRARVRYVDRLTVPELRLQYPELDRYPLVPVDIVDDGERLSSQADASLDFIVGNHLLEHTENPLGTLRNHLAKVHPGGFLYYAVPDKRFSFDIRRPLTPFEHLVKDDQEGPAGSRVGHFYEWSELVNKQEREAIGQDAQRLLEMNYSIHFHVWDEETFTDFLGRARDYLGVPFTVEHLSRNDTEMLAVLRKP